MAFPIHHVEIVGALGDFAAPAQVAQHHVEREIGPHHDGVEVHQAAGGILVVGEHRAQALPVLLLHGQQQFLDHVLRHLGQDVRQVVGLQPFGGGDQLLRLHLLDQGGADFLVEVGEDLAFGLAGNLFPDFTALIGGKGFEQVGDFRRVHLGELLRDLCQVVFPEPLGDELKGIRLFFLGCCAHLGVLSGCAQCNRGR